MYHVVTVSLGFFFYPPQNSAEAKKLCGSRAAVNARLVKASNQWGMNTPTDYSFTL